MLDCCFIFGVEGNSVTPGPLHGEDSFQQLLARATTNQPPTLPMPSPPAATTQPALRRNWHTTIPRIPASASRTPRLLKRQTSTHVPYFNLALRCEHRTKLWLVYGRGARLQPKQLALPLPPPPAIRQEVDVRAPTQNAY